MATKLLRTDSPVTISPSQTSLAEGMIIYLENILTPSHIQQIFSIQLWKNLDKQKKYIYKRKCYNWKELKTFWPKKNFSVQFLLPRYFQKLPAADRSECMGNVIHVYLNSFPYKDAFWCLCNRQPLKTLWQNKKLLTMFSILFNDYTLIYSVILP